MAYPAYVTVTLIEINGNSCGELKGLMSFDSEITPPEYYLTEGDFTYGRLWRVDTGGGNHTWHLRLYVSQGTCAGLHDFRLQEAADNPLGDYCFFENQTLDCEKGQASVIET
ncbi:MAG: hypothetical protein KGY81_10755 [Phycisphaerae bacterium]|jgi:hypothetical protein|nr:hypothetical protein [Phycisphaerae bacterium]